MILKKKKIATLVLMKLIVSYLLKIKNKNSWNVHLNIFLLIEFLKIHLMTSSSITCMDDV